MRSVVACLLLSLGAATWEHSKRTRWIGRWTQKKKYAGQPVDAWLYWCAPPKDTEEWVYMPVMESVAEGLRRFDANASVAYADASVSVDIPGRARALRAATGRKTLVILFGWWNRRIAANQALFARLGRDENVYLVLYQSEPLAHAFTVRPSFYGARELWDYSAGNLALLRRRKDQTGPAVLRFVARCRRQTYHVFRHRFDVAAIFRRAQVPDLLRSLGWRLPPRSGEGRAQGRVIK